MTILSVLQARIADDLARPDIPNQIADAINDAILHYQSTRFYFNERLNVFFSTVVGQAVYNQLDSEDIPRFFEFDEVQITVNGNVCSLEREDAPTLKALVGSNTASGTPFSWAWGNQSIILYPIPDDVWAINLMGGYKYDAPIDDTAGNVWMTEAFELIRAHAKVLLAMHVVNDEGLAQRMSAAAEGAKARLERETSSKRATSRIMATAF